MIRTPLLMLLLATAVAHAAPTPESCAGLRHHGRLAEAAACFTALSTSADPSLRAEGLWGIDQFDQANEAFRQAVAQPGSKPLTRVRWGLLLHQRFNNKEAVDLFHEALQQDPANAQAYLGLALVSADGFDTKAAEYAAKALTLNPKLVEAHELLANLALENGHQPEAAAEADQALALSPEALQAMAIHAAIEVLADRPPDSLLDRIHALNPHYGEGDALIGYHLILNRRYDDGVAFYRKAIDADPTLWAARSQLGINLMRLGQEEEPLRQLEMSYNHGQRDAATVNSLRLLDSYKNFVTFRDQTTILRLRKTEADLLRPYIDSELHKAIATYQAKYKMTLPAPVQLEVYPDHEDFAVRTMGMPGLGALGVTFGEVVAMDSPSGRKPGDFNWGSTLWHEMSHVYILTATRHRVPRWFAEGLAVHEEGQANPRWASRPTPEVLLAIRDKKLLPVADIDRGFIFPTYPSQVIVSYFEAGSMCDYIRERWGEPKLLDMTHSFAALKPTPEVIQVDLQLAPARFDKDFLAWLDQRYGKTAASFDTWRGKMKELAVLTKANCTDDILKLAPEVILLYPDYVGDANAYEALATVQAAVQDKPAAVATLAAYQALGGEDPQLLSRLAALQEELGHPADAAATLDAINFIYPVTEALHRHLGELWLAQGNGPGAMREFSAVLALKPLDTASAEFNMARAYLLEGEKAKAEESVLLALETAPGFRPAQKLLLQIKSDQPR